MTEHRATPNSAVTQGQNAQSSVQNHQLGRDILFTGLDGFKAVSIRNRNIGFCHADSKPRNPGCFAASSSMRSAAALFPASTPLHREVKITGRSREVWLIGAYAGSFI